LICGVYTESVLRRAVTARRKFFFVDHISHEATTEVLSIKKKRKERKIKDKILRIKKRRGKNEKRKEK
jgi:hypothetical protein